MVTSSALIPSSADTKSTSLSTLLPRKSSNISSSGAFSDVSHSFGHEENSADSLYDVNSSSGTSASHYVIKCTLNTSTSTTNTSASPMSNSLSMSAPPVTLTPRVKVTVQQPSITSPPACMNSSSESIPSSSSSFLLKTPTSNMLPFFSPSIMTMSTASSAPEFSISGASSIDDSEELALYEQYLSISYGRQSNPSPEMRKKSVEDSLKLQQRLLPRSKSETNNSPAEQSSQHHHQQQNTLKTSQIKTVSKCSSL